MKLILLLIKAIIGFSRLMAYAATFTLGISRSLTAFCTGRTIFYIDTGKTHRSLGRLYNDLWGTKPEEPTFDGIKVEIYGTADHPGASDSSATPQVAKVSSAVASAVRAAVREEELQVKQVEAELRATINKHGSILHPEVGIMRQKVIVQYEVLNKRVLEVLPAIQAYEEERTRKISEELDAFRKKLATKESGPSSARFEGDLPGDAVGDDK